VVILPFQFISDNLQKMFVPFGNVSAMFSKISTILKNALDKSTCNQIQVRNRKIFKLLVWVKIRRFENVFRVVEE
jgi:hypothetical protein